MSCKLTISHGVMEEIDSRRTRCPSTRSSRLSFLPNEVLRRTPTKPNPNKEEI
jgi:hypothetical protein